MDAVEILDESLIECIGPSAARNHIRGLQKALVAERERHTCDQCSRKLEDGALYEDHATAERDVVSLRHACDTLRRESDGRMQQLLAAKTANLRLVELLERALERGILAPVTRAQLLASDIRAALARMKEQP